MLEKAVVRRLRVGVVPGSALDRLSVGYGGVAARVRDRLDSLRAGGNVASLFVRGEWGSGKSHLMAFVRSMAAMQAFATSIVPLNARSAPLNFPQRFYPLLVENLKCQGPDPGLRVMLPAWLRDGATRERLVDFSWSAAASDLGWRLRALANLYGQEELPVNDGEWAWTGLLGGDLSWADYGYKRVQALDRIQALALLLLHAGFGGLVVTFDEAETIDQLWNIRSRLVAYDVLGRLTSMRALWCLFGITNRFTRTIEGDFSRGVLDSSETSEHARRFLRSWQQARFEVLELPTISNALARSLVRSVADLYCRAYSLPPVDDGFVTRCVAIWAQNPSRNPRRLLRLVVHHLDLTQRTAPVLDHVHESNPLPEKLTAAVAGGAVSPDQVQKEFDSLVEAVPDLSGREPNKFKQLKTWLAHLLGLRPERVSVKYLGTPNNLKNRLTESGGQDPELTLALTGPDDVSTVVRNARLLIGEGKPLKAVAVATKDGSHGWSIVAFAQARETELATRLREFFPAVKVEWLVAKQAARTEAFENSALPSSPRRTPAR